MLLLIVSCLSCWCSVLWSFCRSSCHSPLHRRIRSKQRSVARYSKLRPETCLRLRENSNFI